jgi:hypothetical protein
MYLTLQKYKKEFAYSMTENERKQFEDEILKYLEKNKLIAKTGRTLQSIMLRMSWKV